MIPSHSFSLDGLADIAAVFVYLKAECSLAFGVCICVTRG
jgi:hypothetical protein